jgi:hypothetical protein
MIWSAGFAASSRAVRLSMLLLLLGLVPCMAASEARIVVKGDTLRGRVADLTSDGVSFEPIHGKGSILVPWSDVENLVTEDRLAILHGDKGETYGRVLGMSDGQLLVGESVETAERIDTATLFMALSDDFGQTVMDRLRSRFRYWTAAFDSGVAYTDSTTDKASGFAALRFAREKGPTRLLVEGEARYANEKEQGEDRSVTENRMYGFARGEYDYTERFFDYVSVRATHDAIQHLGVRLEPRGGAGVHLIKGPDLNFSTDVGIVWIYEDYYGDEFVDGFFPLERSRGSDDHFAIAFGAQADAKLPYGALWRARAEYLPAVDDWGHDYLARFETGLDFPLLEWLAFTVAIRDEYDNTPAEGTERNTFTTTAGLSFRFP